MGGCHVFIPCEVGQDVFMLLLDLSFNLTEALWNRKRLWPAKCIGMWIYLYIHNTILHRHIYHIIHIYIYISLNGQKWGGRDFWCAYYIMSGNEGLNPSAWKWSWNSKQLGLGYTIFRQAPCIINYIVYFPKYQWQWLIYIYSICLSHKINVYHVNNDMCPFTARWIQH